MLIFPKQAARSTRAAVAWIASQGPEFTENILWQNDLLVRLREEGFIRAKVHPASA
jgi:hypothetical protein